VLAGKTTLTAHISENSGVDSVYFYLRKPNGGDGTPIGYEDLQADFNDITGQWEYDLDTSHVSNGSYVILADAIYGCGITGSSELVPVTVSNKTIVPNIVGKIAAEANTAIVKANLKVGTVTAAYSNTVVAGKVISQNPAAGTKVNIGSKVNYVKSLGKSTIVPNVVGKTAANANTAIVNANLVVGAVTTAYSDTVAKDKVISQNPTANTTVAVGSKVNYVKSLGKPVVPNIVGKTAADANTAITSVDNLKVGTVTTAYSNTVAAGKVISQNPAAGTKVTTGSKVNYVRSLGKSTIVPKVVGKTAAAANAAIVKANLVVGTVTTAYSNTVAAGKVISQNPAAGTKVAVGSKVNYVKSLGFNVVGTWTGTWYNGGSSGSFTLNLKSDNTLNGSYQQLLEPSGSATIPVTGTYNFNSTNNAVTFECQGQTTVQGYPYKAHIDGSGHVTSSNKASGDYWVTAKIYYDGYWHIIANNAHGTYVDNK
jgi:beta-lactam-binding protein with PASTA domain